MHPSGLLILTTHISSLCKGDAVARILTNVGKFVKSTLYVHLINVHGSTSINKDSSFTVSNLLHSTGSRPLTPHTFNADVLPFVTKFYSQCALHCGHLDVNVLLHNIGESSSHPQPLPKPINCILVDLPKSSDEVEDTLRTYVDSTYSNRKDEAGATSQGTSVDPVEKMPVYTFNLTDSDVKCDKSDENVGKTSTIIKREAVVLGGTFDHLHSGHKVLLSEAILMASRKIVIGLSDGPLLARKTLKDLIQPISLRKRLLEEFILSVARPGIELIIESINDPYGPSIVDPDLQMIVVSGETEKGGHMVNDKRRERELSILDVHIIGQGTLLEDSTSDTIPFEENKASSSSARFRLLGTLLKPSKDLSLDFIPTSKMPIIPYIIGLTGGIAAGKSSVAKRMEEMGAIIIDCDKLGHKSYIPGSNAYTAIVEHFGKNIVSDIDNVIDRRKLGAKVFADKSQLNFLNSVVWPEIERLCKQEISNHMQELISAKDVSKPVQVFVLDAAILLEAGWDGFVHEVWAVNVPVEEAIQRIIERNNISEEDARKRINSQSTNEWRTERANVVLSTLWDPAVTQKLIEKSWDLLGQRLNKRTSKANLCNMASSVGDKSHKL
ncbi:bifunctional coenzyme A synthase-like [Styela clava]